MMNTPTRQNRKHRSGQTETAQCQSGKQSTHPMQVTESNSSNLTTTNSPCPCAQGRRRPPG
jgi:hypothetical protein